MLYSKLNRGPLADIYSSMEWGVFIGRGGKAHMEVACWGGAVNSLQGNGRTFSKVEVSNLKIEPILALFTDKPGSDQLKIDAFRERCV